MSCKIQSCLQIYHQCVFLNFYVYSVWDKTSQSSLKKRTNLVAAHSKGMHCFCVRCSLQVFFNEIIQYLLIGFLLYHILIFAIFVSKSTVARSMAPDFCWTCPLTHHWYEWLNVALLHKDHLFPQLHLQHSSTDLLHFWIHKLPIHPLYKHRNCMDVFHCKKNKFA